ncbi:MAG: fibronectin type III domain-containing protein [Solirubrobacteraceae bacterium]
MRRLLKVLAALCALAAFDASAALAASSPAVATGSATELTNTSAALNGTVNPNGSSTSYDFEYGLTTAYGFSTASHSAGSGTKAKSISLTISGLIPGTIYHYRLDALNEGGGSLGADRSFKTTGFPPAAVITGPASGVGTSVATLTGTVDPEGASTAWLFQYGLTIGYGYETFAQTLAASSSTLTVSAQVTGIEPGTLFHYRLVAYHGSVATVGADQTLLTEPSPRPIPRVRASTTPHRARHKPFVFTTNATVVGPASIPAPYECTGSAAIRYWDGRKVVRLTVAALAPNCTFSAPVSFAHQIGRHSTRLRVTIFFRGNGYLAPVNARSEFVTLG